MAHCGRLIQVQFAGPSVIVKTISEVGILLNFAQNQSGSHRVNRSRGNKKRISRRRVEPLQKLFNLARERCLLQSLDGVMASLKPAAIRAPGSAATTYHISVFPLES